MALLPNLQNALSMSGQGGGYKAGQTIANQSSYLPASAVTGSDPSSAISKQYIEAGGDPARTTGGSTTDTVGNGLMAAGAASGNPYLMAAATAAKMLPELGIGSDKKSGDDKYKEEKAKNEHWKRDMSQRYGAMTYLGQNIVAQNAALMSIPGIGPALAALNTIGMFYKAGPGIREGLQQVINTNASYRRRRS